MGVNPKDGRTQNVRVPGYLQYHLGNSGGSNTLPSEVSQQSQCQGIFVML